MMELDQSSLFSRVVGGSGLSEAVSIRKFSDTSSTSSTVLQWLASTPIDPRRAANRLKPVSRRERERADSILLGIEPPEDSLASSELRALLLGQLHGKAPQDRRSQCIFAEDPIVAADPDTGIVVTESIFQARLGQFDALATLIGDEPLSGAARSAMRVALGRAFEFLKPGSQQEWALSELRFEQSMSFLEGHDPSTLGPLGDEIAAINNRKGGWDAIRVFSLAAAMARPSPANRSVHSLIELR